MSGSALFGAPWDQKLTMLTILFSTLMLGSTGLVVWLALTRVPVAPIRLLMILGAVVPVAAFVIAAMMGPRGYAIADGRLRIDRLIRPIEIPLSSIRSVERLPPDRLAGSLRTLGSGGLFGYYGTFRNEELGEYRMYATRGDGYVLVRADRPYVLTPESPDVFVETLDRERAAR
jgi:PH (Pleckstrin Homology) domain-containing protein